MISITNNHEICTTGQWTHTHCKVPQSVRRGSSRPSSEHMYSSSSLCCIFGTHANRPSNLGQEESAINVVSYTGATPCHSVQHHHKLRDSYRVSYNQCLVARTRISSPMRQIGRCSVYFRMGSGLCKDYYCMANLSGPQAAQAISHLHPHSTSTETLATN